MYSSTPNLPVLYHVLIVKFVNSMYSFTKLSLVWHKNKSIRLPVKKKSLIMVLLANLVIYKAYLVYGTRLTV